MKDRFRVVMWNKFLEKFHRRLGVDRLGKSVANRQCVDVYDAVDVHVLARTIRLEFTLLATSNPTVSWNTVVLRMATVSEVKNLVFARIFPELTVFSDEIFLLFCVRFSRHVLRFFIHETEFVQQSAHVWTRQNHTVCFSHVSQNHTHVQEEIFVQPGRQFFFCSCFRWVTRPR